MTTQINPSEETFSFQLLDYEIEHQGEAVIDLKVDLDLKEGIGEDDPFEYPDFVPIRDYITDFLVDYPNETDFWEILNKNLVTSLLTEPIPLDEVLDSITVDIDVQPGSSGIETPRSSMAVGTPQFEAIALDETFSFQLLDNDLLFLGSGEGNNIVTGGNGDRSVVLVSHRHPRFTQSREYNYWLCPHRRCNWFCQTTLEFDDLNLIQDGSNTIINALDRDLAILLDTQTTDLNKSDFVFAW